MPLHGNSLFYGLASTMTPEQRSYVDSIIDNQLTIVNAAAGTGKTTLAVGAAKIIGKPLIYVFAPVAESELGFRPGDTQAKQADYLQPLKDALIAIGEDPSKAIYDEMNAKRGSAWVYPSSHVFQRGINVRDVTVIIDECQNFTLAQLRKVLTRIHDICHVVMIGHSGQCDLKRPSDSGFERYIAHFKDEPYVKVCTLTKNFRGRLATHADAINA